ncbi:hypothetical protein PGB90_000959 [Kerria lacca]
MKNLNDLSYVARMSPHIISKIVMDVCRALIEILREQFQMPNSPDGWKMITQTFDDECHFQNCIGVELSMVHTWPYRTHFRTTFKWKKTTPSVIVDNSAFTLKPNITTPYLENDSTVKNSRERIFNYCLSSARSLRL